MTDTNITEPSMNTFAVFVEDSDPVERIEDAPTNEARQEADQVETIEEAEYLIAEILLSWPYTDFT